MYRHFLVPVDGADTSVDAIGQAVQFAQSIGARITFRPVRHERAANWGWELLAWELSTRAEAAARAQGVACSLAASSGDASFASTVAAAREHGCDLICAAQTAGGFDASELPVLISAINLCPAQRDAIGILLNEHRAIAGELHACLSAVRAARDEGRLPALPPMQEAVRRLRNLQTGGHRPKTEAWLFARLRERTSTVDAELDELERQHRHAEQLLDALAQLIEGGPPSGLSAARLDETLTAYAQFTWEHMGREEGAVLPAARRYLRDTDWAEIAAAYAALPLDSPPRPPNA
jgi:hemerythrin-like domain-containing protein